MCIVARKHLLKNPSNMIIYKNRNEMVHNILKPGYIGVELGVLKGDFSQTLYCYNPSRLDLVDLWIPNSQSMSGDEDGNNLQIYDTNYCYDQVVSKFKDKNEVNIIRSNSIDYIKSVKPNTYDFVYIDTDHSYDVTIVELNLIFNKVKIGGFICGHDFDLNSKCKQVYNFGVDIAVFEFCYKHNQKIHSLAMDGCESFAIQKR